MPSPILLDFTIGRELSRQIPSGEIYDFLQLDGNIDDQYQAGDCVQLDGTISFLVEGEEFLGRDCWFELYNTEFVALLPTRKRSSWDFAQREGYGSLVFERVEQGRVACVRQYEGKPINDVVVSEFFLLRSWAFLFFRIWRLAAHLGDQTSDSRLFHFYGFYSEKFSKIADRHLLQFAQTAPLEELLSNPCPPKI